ncbi:putative Serine hydrolase FSH domain-containing protein [Seiridium cardinale]
MSAPAQNGAAKGAAKPNGKKELKILMLHGYTQSGPLFRSKTGALNKILQKFLGTAPLNLQPQLIYPTGPHRLKPSDIPGYQPPEGKSLDEVDDEETDNWGWFRRDEATGTYKGFAEGMLRVAETVSENGGVDGVIGFSQGGAMASLVAAALETERALPAHMAAEDSWARKLREANGGKQLKFGVVYSGFVARDEDLQWMYEGGIQTPTLHFIGGLDTVVEESRSRGLTEQCREDRTRVLVHPGGHYVPVSKEWTGALVMWLREVLQEPKESREADEKL